MALGLESCSQVQQCRLFHVDSQIMFRLFNRYMELSQTNFRSILLVKMKAFELNQPEPFYKFAKVGSFPLGNSNSRWLNLGVN